MLAVILHLFLLHPIFNYLKTLPKKSNGTRMSYSLSLLVLIASFTLHQHFTTEKQKNLYDVLGVSPAGYTPAELKKSYRQLSLEFHPDKSNRSDASELFAKINSGNLHPHLDTF